MSGFTRSELKEKVLNISNTRGIPKIRLNASNDALKQWIKDNSFQFNDLTLGLSKIEKSKILKERISNRDFQAIFEAIKDGQKLFKHQAEDVFKAMISNDQRYMITLNETSFPVNQANKEFIENLLRKGFVEADENEAGSDRQKAVLSEDITFILVELLIRPVVPINRDQDGAFFSRLNAKHDIFDLTRYQIFPTAQESENCLIHTLGLCGIDNDKINSVKLSLTVGTSISKKSLTKIAEIIGMTIQVNEYDKIKKQIRKYKYGKFARTINIALYCNHYFVYEDTIYTKYSVKNYESLQTKKNWNDYIQKNEKKADAPRTDSLNLVVNLDLLGDVFYYGNMNTAPESAEHKDTRNLTYLDNISVEQRLIPPFDIKTNTKKIYYGDCETFVSEGSHKLFLLGIIGESESEPSIYNFSKLNDFQKQNRIYEVFDKITNLGKCSVIIYFHNLKYDYNVLEPYLNIQSVCKKDNQLYSVKVQFKNSDIELRDSLKIASMPLAKFCSNFALPKDMDKLEAINYTYYTEENSNNYEVSTHIYAEGLPNKEKKIFWEAVGVDTKLFDPIEYYIHYLKMDCLVLKHGMEKFNEVILSIDSRLSIHDSLTISSLTDKYMLINGAYEGVYENTGNLRDYLSKAVYGGRVHVNQKFLKKVVEEKIADYDGVSLYPSAINRLCREHGLPVGRCVRLNKTTHRKIDDFKETEYAVLTIQITNVGKNQQMPMLAVKSTDSIKYTNDCPIEPITIDLYTLQDYIKFHEIEYEILDGVIWSTEESNNKRMGELIQSLFDLRLKNKNTNAGLANVLKLMLNSAYGKTIMKKSTTQTRIIRREEILYNKNTNEFHNQAVDNYNKFVHKNFNTTKKIRAISTKLFEVDQLSVDTSYNRGHIGCAILSYSKRIMNEVFDVANTGKMPIYYTDTDSIHMKFDDVEKLEKQFHDCYNKNLTGKSLEQFHIDFELKGAVGDVYSTKFLALGKKSYVDELEGFDKDGLKMIGFHTRLKGITEASIEYHSKEYMSVFEMYEELSKGIPKTMILNPFNIDKNYQKPIFQYIDGGVKTRESASFTRTLKF
jgi:hypothetical protein